ncbi:hypothetical protein PYCCODRAFT_1444958 [Trametes coccinea BRFM310]|uniref:Protein kinase domain-containing protein n=1 Tax=Trametes coccinea (strain BRFM310) TaxID=1353009 RepID=A0A1Y2IN38_TRAC3|nr:hypothetical protein PYCCODRAFT_1444958 [Trametes coccinea BRFM310]
MLALSSVLQAGAFVGRFTPMIPLREAALVLLQIWDAFQRVRINRATCVRLVERCATILLSIREDIAHAGEVIGDQLQKPIARLVESFRLIEEFVHKQAKRPFLASLIQRDETARSLGDCHNDLNDALGSFGVRPAYAVHSRSRYASWRKSPSHPKPCPSRRYASPPILACDDAYQCSNTSHSCAFMQHIDSKDILRSLAEIVKGQNEDDMLRDADELRARMRAALLAPTDMEMIQILQVGRDEMPEAIRTLQRVYDGKTSRRASAIMDDAARKLPAIQEDVVSETAQAPHVVRPVGEQSDVLRSPAPLLSQPTDNLDQKFIETGLSALRRMSTDAVLPSWTITRFEIDKVKSIGRGFWADVYRGTWQGRTVAIKQLTQATPRQLFLHEVTIWKALKHHNVLKIYGASSTTSDPPWYLVSPYLRHGSLDGYLKGLPSLESANVPKMLYEIADGMAYLHKEHVLHGDLKAVNVLVNDDLCCVICDFGQSKIKAEVYRISGVDLPQGTLRWKAPELLSNHGRLTNKTDVYAFAITAVEIMTKGDIPFGVIDDDVVRKGIPKGLRPTYEPKIQSGWSSQVTELIERSWHNDPQLRPTFALIVQQIQLLRRQYSEGPLPVASGTVERRRSSSAAVSSEVDSRSHTQHESRSRSSMNGEGVRVGLGSNLHVSARDVTAASVPKEPQAAFDGPDAPTENLVSASVEHPTEGQTQLRHDSPAEESHDSESEEQYRTQLQHEFHDSLTLPLWTPSPVPLGAVGYHSIAQGGKFVVLFNSQDPAKSSGSLVQSVPPISAYGIVRKDNRRHVARNTMKDTFGALFSKTNVPPLQRIGNHWRSRSFPLRAGHKAAHLITSSTSYDFFENLDTPKKWLKGNAANIVTMYGDQHRISREQLSLVIGTLSAENYALFVSQEHRTGKVQFNLTAASQLGHPWGAFTLTQSSPDIGGPKYGELANRTARHEYKVSEVRENRGSAVWDSVLLARLSFEPDSVEPTLC